MRAGTRSADCSLCGERTPRPLYYHPGEHVSPEHGVDGWRSDFPLCITCARLMVFGSFDPPLVRSRRGNMAPKRLMTARHRVAP